MRKMILKDIMCDHPIKINEKVHVGTVAHLLLRYRINGILVVKKKNNNQLVGIFTITDLFKFINDAFSKGIHKIKELRKVADLPVGKVATKQIISLQKDATVAKAIVIMRSKNIHTIPIYDKDKLVGVVGSHDILNIAFNYYE